MFSRESVISETTTSLSSARYEKEENLKTISETNFLESRTPLSRRLARRLVAPLAVPVASRLLRRRQRRADGIEAHTDIAFGFDVAGVDVRPWQMRSELLELLRELEERRPRVVVEIGTSAGGTLLLFTRVAAADALIVSIDLPGGQFGGGYPWWRGFLYRSFARPFQRLELLRADSHDPKTVERLRRIIGKASIDFLFIDGDHTYEGVKTDFEMYLPLVASGGLVALHDIVPDKSDSGEESHLAGGVPIFWRELRERFDTREFVENWDQGSFGIGLISRP